MASDSVPTQTGSAEEDVTRADPQEKGPIFQEGPIKFLPAPDTTIDQAVPDLTFGVEAEFLLLFHLDGLMEAIYGAEGEGDEKQQEAWHKKKAAIMNGKHDLEPFLYVARILNGQGYGQFYVRGQFTNDTASLAYDRWIVSNEDLDRDRETFRRPDSLGQCGLELVSPIGKYPQDAGPFASRLVGMASTLSPPLGSRQLDAMTSVDITQNCGLHVHIGLAPKPSSDDPEEMIQQAWPLSAAQHLAYLLIVYEDEILSLFPSTRLEQALDKESTITSMRWEIAENRDQYPESFEYGVFDYWHPKYNNIQRGDQVCRLVSLTTIRREIFSTTTVAEFLEKIGSNRFSLVNFCNLPDSDSSQANEACPTIEFRQAASSKDAHEILLWIDFVAALVNLAWRNAASGVVQATGWADASITVGHLMDVMELPQPVCQFWDMRRRTHSASISRSLATIRATRVWRSPLEVAEIQQTLSASQPRGSREFDDEDGEMAIEIDEEEEEESQQQQSQQEGETQEEARERVYHEDEEAMQENLRYLFAS